MLKPRLASANMQIKHSRNDHTSRAIGNLGIAPLERRPDLDDHSVFIDEDIRVN